MLKRFNVFLLLLQLFLSGNIDVDAQPHPDRKSAQKCREIYFSENPAVRSTRSIHERVVRSSGNDLGKIQTTPGEFPYMAVLGWRNDDGGYKFQCGGVLISRDFILTAAHCVTNSRQGSPEVVRIGGASLQDADSNANIPIKQIYAHPDYKSSLVYNDIALVQLESPSDHLPACLWQTNEIKQTEATAIGYGSSTIGGEGSKDLLKVNLDIFTKQECNSFYTETIRRLMDGIIDSQICAGSRDSSKVRDTCQGDAGGPLIVKLDENSKQIPYTTGIISFGKSCGAGVPFVLTRVSSYLDWIEDIVWP